MTTEIILSIEHIVSEFKVSTAAVRAWVLKGLIKPVRREGKGRDGKMWFARGDVGNLVYGICKVCGNGFRKATIKQRFCSTLCRQRFARLNPDRQA